MKFNQNLGWKELQLLRHSVLFLDKPGNRDRGRKEILELNREDLSVVFPAIQTLQQTSPNFGALKYVETSGKKKKPNYSLSHPMAGYKPAEPKLEANKIAPSKLLTIQWGLELS